MTRCLAGFLTTTMLILLLTLSQPLPNLCRAPGLSHGPGEEGVVSSLEDPGALSGMVFPFLPVRSA